ncbi:SIMPL domain-containing protein [Altererythrobacter sp. ZODW24]|uniref:SIMPL domain-containing protein n=1 Tax=Altererythrobacter sp. ZODW24 TaxID=2185142 RepID=UPI000DF85B2F|nr:SIMPL domain-containing protein [Altererythrobacter sp. ZODW24]
MIRYALPLLAATAITLPASAAEVQMQVQGPVVELSVTETVKARPDIATVSAGVSTQARTAVEAMRLNAQQMDAIIKKIKALGVGEDDIQTSGINLNAQYDYDRTNQRQVFRGYQVSNRVSVILREIDETGPVLDALVASGATDLGGPSFSIDDDTAARAQARKAAWAKANAQAIEYAQMAGYSGVRLLEVSENVFTSRAQPMMRQTAVEAAMSDTSTPVQPGLVGTAVTISVKYEMTR